MTGKRKRKMQVLLNDGRIGTLIEKTVCDKGSDKTVLTGGYKVKIDVDGIITTGYWSTLIKKEIGYK